MGNFIKAKKLCVLCGSDPKIKSAAFWEAALGRMSSEGIKTGFYEFAQLRSNVTERG